MGFQAIAFDAYSSSLAGHVVGDKMKDVATGITYQLVQAGQSLTNSAVAVNEVVVQKSGTVHEVTNDVSTGLDATYPIPKGRANSACPQSTASVTYYFWVQKDGIGTVVTNGDDDIAAGNMLIPSAVVDGACDSLAGSATNTADGVLAGMFGRALAVDVDAANTVSALLNFPN